jgi:integrase
VAHIQKMTDKPRTLFWRAHIHRKGHKPLVKMFATRKEAERWTDEQERSIRLAGLPLTNEELKKHTVGYLVERYLKEIAPGKGSYVTIEATIDKFLGYDIAKMSLAYVKPKDAYEYIADRQKEKWRGKPIKNSTIKRDISIFASAFTIARKRWGFDNLANPFADLDKDALRGSNNRRNRRLKEGEENKLWEACQHCLGLNRVYVPLAIALAIHTGMRLQEIFNLTWQDVDFKNRLIEIRKSKTDHKSKYAGRTIVLTIRADYFLGQLAMSLSQERRLKPTDRIFPMTKGAFKQSWFDVRKRAGIKEQLMFHDLRHEAASRFDEADLSTPQRNLMMGHTDPSTGAIYVHSHLKIIQDKLDRYMLEGKTLDEAWKEWATAGLGLPKGARTAQSQEELLEWLAKAGIKGRFLGFEDGSITETVLQGSSPNVVPFAKAKAS